MAEWLNAPVLKTGILKGIWGSNPCFSAHCKVLELAISVIAWQTSPPVSGVMSTK